jgi:hypothetical protein
VGLFAVQTPSVVTEPAFGLALGETIIVKNYSECTVINASYTIRQWQKEAFNGNIERSTVLKWKSD